MRIKISDDVLVRVYKLYDPRDNTQSPKYIGITIKSLETRLKGHISKHTLKTRTHKNNWVKSLLKEDVTPAIQIIEEVVGWNKACEVEKYWIKEFKIQGCTLTNSTDGGEGSIGVLFREETRHKLSIQNKGSKNAMYGKIGKDSPAWGRVHTEDEKRRIKESNLITLRNKEKPNDFGLTYDSKRNRWITCIFVAGIKYMTGTYGTKERANQVIDEIYYRRYADNPITEEEIKLIIKKYTEIEWCNKFINKLPSVNYKAQLRKWVSRISDGTKRYHLGLFNTKEEAENAYNKEANKLIANILNKYNISIESI